MTCSIVSVISFFLLFFWTQNETNAWKQTQTVCVMRTKNYTSSTWSQSCIAVVSVHLVRVRCGPITAVAMLQIEQRRGNCTGRCASQHATPSHATLVRHVSSETIRGVLARWPKHSQTFWFPRTTDRQLPEQRPQVAPVHKGQGVQGKCVLCASGLPGEPHHACPLAVVACHRGATHTPWWCQWPPGPHHTQAKSRPPPPICVHPKHSALGRPCHGSSNLCALVRQLLCRCVP